MEELEEGVLPVGAGLPEVDLPDLVVDLVPIHRHVLAVGLHVHLFFLFEVWVVLGGVWG